MYKTLRSLSASLFGVLLVACSTQPAAQAPHSSAIPASSVVASPPVETQIAVAPAPTVTVPPTTTAEQPVQRTPVPSPPTTTPATSSSEPSTAATASSTPPLADGQIVLQVASGSAEGQVGITSQAGPNTFRVAADGSLRIMDTVNKRLLFYAQGQEGANGKLQKTIDLASLKRPSDFAVTTVGDVFVLDVDGWALAMYSMDGALQNVTPLHPSLKGLFSSISLTADGSLWGVGQDKHHSLIFDSPTSPPDVTDDASYAGAVTVRSAAYFSIGREQQSDGQSVLSISNVGDGTPIQYNLGQLDGQPTFLDINQGMEPYVLVQKQTVSEVRRYSVEGQLLGTLTLDQQNCRPMSRSIYVDRPGDVYVMCVDEAGATITRLAITDADSQALPLFDELVTTVPWSPASLQAAPG